MAKYASNICEIDEEFMIVAFDDSDFDVHIDKEVDELTYHVM